MCNQLLNKNNLYAFDHNDRMYLANSIFKRVFLHYRIFINVVMFKVVYLNKLSYKCPQTCSRVYKDVQMGTTGPN